MRGTTLKRGKLYCTGFNTQILFKHCRNCRRSTGKHCMTESICSLFASKLANVLSFLCPYALGNGDYKGLALLHKLCHAVFHIFIIKRNLGKKNHSRTLAVVTLCKSTCRSKPACISAHDFHNSHTLKVVNKAVAHKLLCNCGNKFCRTAKAGGVVGCYKVVINGFGNAHKLDIRLFKFIVYAELFHGVHGIISADIEKALDVILFKNLKKLLVNFISFYRFGKLKTA